MYRNLQVAFLKENIVYKEIANSYLTHTAAKVSKNILDVDFAVGYNH